MCNQVVLVGRLIEKNEDNTLSMAVNRSFKNEEGQYETDKIKVYIWGTIAEKTKEYCRVGDVIGVRGRVQTDKINGEMKIIAEKVTFLNSTRKKESEE